MITNNFSLIHKILKTVQINLICCLLFIFIFGCTLNLKAKPQKPNVLIIYCDDLGYGDVGYQNPNSKIPTPNIDKLAKSGVCFTNAHAAAAICGPSRYGLLTGRYSWRKPDGAGNGKLYDECKIEPNRKTLAIMFKELGYNTAQMGKWGLRNSYHQALKESAKRKPLDNITPKDFDFSKPIDAPKTRGFNYAFTMTMLAGKRNGRMHPNDKWLFENGYPYPKGVTPDPAHFQWLKCFPTVTQKVLDYINTYAGNMEYKPFNIDRSKPFFIYFDPHTPHEPIVPNKEFWGKSSAGKYGDFVSELDYRVGLVLDTLKKNGLMDNTIIIFSSDNGAEGTSYNRIKKYNHYSNGKLRGAKRDAWEAGNRVPCIIKWPGKTSANKKCDTAICLTDIFSTFAEEFNYQYDENCAEDSYSFLSLLSNQNIDTKRPPIIYHTHRRVMAINCDNWVYIDAPTGMDNREPEWFRKERGVVKHHQKVELFNLNEDLQELINVADKYPEKVKQMKEKLIEMMKTNKKEKKE